MKEIKYNMSEKVSIVTPCYNGEAYIKNYMKSVLQLEYDNIQLIIVDDGSTDNSYEELKKYKNEMQQHNIEFILLHKENGGQPSAINCGVKYATGKYLVWPDIDDNMHYDFLKCKVEYMETHPEIDFLLSKSAIVPLNNPQKIYGYTWPEKITDSKELFYRVVNDRKCWFEPGAYMARLSSFDKFIPNRHIYDECGRWSGPQTQITMPFFYYGKVGYLDKCLYDYYIHDKQDHNKYKDKDKLKQKSIEVKKMLTATVKSLHTSEEEKILKMIDERIIRTESVIAFQYEDLEWFLEEYKKFDKSEKNLKDKLRYIIIKNQIINKMYRFYLKVNKNKMAVRY